MSHPSGFVSRHAAGRWFPAWPPRLIAALTGRPWKRRLRPPAPAIAVCARYHALLQTHADRGGGLELGRPGGDRWVAILPDPSGAAGTFKVQPFDAAGIGPHVGGYATARAARWAARAAGYTEPAPGTFTRLARSAGWQTRYGPPNE